MRRRRLIPLALILIELVCAPGALAQAPDTTIDSAPSGLTNSANATFSFSGTGTSFQCKLDGGAFTVCTSPHGLSGLPDGQHTFQVRAVSGAGGSDPTPASHTWTVDTTPPDTFITSTPPALTGSTSATFSFAFSESGSFQCSVDGAPYALCSSPHTVPGLPDGSHTFAVRAIDLAGNIDASPAAYTWAVDATPPDTSITSGPLGPTASTNALFQFTTTEPGGSFECAVDGGTFAACNPPFQMSSVTEGPHSVQVRAIDAAGNADPSPATRDWTVDTTGPPPPSLSIKPFSARGAPTPSVLPAGRARPATNRFQLTRTLRASWSGGGPYLVQYKKWRAGTKEPNVRKVWSDETSQSAAFTAQSGFTYCFWVSRFDEVGNKSADAKACTSMPYRVNQTSHSNWTLKTSPASYFGQYARGGPPLGGDGGFTTQRVLGLQLIPEFGTQLGEVKQIGLVATTCPSCGKVTVSWNVPQIVTKAGAGVRAAATKSKKLNLTSKTTKRRRLFNVRTFRSSNSDVGVVFVTSSEGAPRVEGIAVGP